MIIQLGRSNVILSFIVMIGLILGYLSFSGLEEPVITTPDDFIVAKNDLETFSNFNVDFSVLENETYKSLEIFGEFPVDPGVTGERKDPFAPI